MGRKIGMFDRVDETLQNAQPLNMSCIVPAWRDLWIYHCRTVGWDLTILMAVRRILFYLPIVISRAPRYHYLSFLFNVIFYPVVFFYDVNGDSFRTLFFPCFTNALPWRFYLDKPWHNLIMHKKIGDCILSHKTDIFQQHSNNFCFLFRPGSFKGPVRLPSPTITK